MDSSLIGVSGAREGFVVVLKDKNGLPTASATLRCMETVKPCDKNDFVIVT